MDSTLLIFACVALGAVAVLCITLAVVAVQAGKNMQRLTSTMEAVGRDVSEIKTETIPLIARTSDVMERADHALIKLDSSLDNLRSGSQAIRGIAEDTRNLEQEVVRRVQPAIDDLTGLFSGAVRGFAAFVKNLMEK